jgi:hypothetical protein
VLLKILSRFLNPLVLILLFAAAISALTGDVGSLVIISTIGSATAPYFHVDETSVSVKGKNGYVWVLASMEHVAFFILRPERVRPSAPCSRIS